MKIAFYGRYSSDNQRETSIDDQRRVVLRWAERYDHAPVADFTDYAIPGASLKTRPGLQAAIQAALSSPCPFDALVMDQLSRLSRDVGDTDSLIKRLKFAGVRVIAVSDGIDTGEKSTKINVTVKSLVNELYLDDLRDTTKRGLDGKFLEGFSTGGRTYGYRTEPVYAANGKTDPRGVPIPAGYKPVPDPVERAVVQQIFQLFKEGQGEKAIARKLNALSQERVWRPNTIYFVLQNPKYVGRWSFNCREWRKNLDTGRRVYRLRPKEQWEVQVRAELRLVDQDTWEAVQQRLLTRQRLFSHAKRGTVHLLSGLLICEECGGASCDHGQGLLCVPEPCGVRAMFERHPDPPRSD